MKQKLRLIAAAALVAAFTSSSRAADYTDTIGDEFTGNGILDITSVEVTNTFADVIFKINLNGDPVASDWGKYCIGIVDTNQPTGDTSANGNGWGRPINLTQGMNYWIGTWVDSGNGAQFWNYNGLWNGPGAATISKTTTNVTITVPIASLNKTYGDSFDFDVYTTGGGGTDSAIDSLANPSQTVSSWSGPYASSLVKTYTLVVPPIPSTNHIKFMVNMEVPIWEYDNAIGDGFDTNTGTVFVRGTFNSWVNNPASQLFRVADSPGGTLYSNTVEVVQYINQSVSYKFYGQSFPAYEIPVLICGADRTLTITNQNMSPTPAVAYWSDRKLSDPIVPVTLQVNMSLQTNYGMFNPGTDAVTAPGSFNGWATNSAALTAGTGPDANIYSMTVTYSHYPIGACNVGNYKYFIEYSPTARDGGWENPILTDGGNRVITITSNPQTNSAYYNDELPDFKIKSVQHLSPDAVSINWESYPARYAIHTGGVYQVESRTAVNSGVWTSNGTVYSTTATSTFTNTGLTGTNQLFYRVWLKSLVP
jgi:hypothetical protein